MPSTRVGLVAFVDLLGFSARVMALKTSDDFDVLKRDISRIHRWFEHRPPKRKTRNKLIFKAVLAFSDCVVVSISTSSRFSRQFDAFDILMAELYFGVLRPQALCAVNGIFLRGGIDFGSWYRSRDILISPAMISAYQLERGACVPMIAVTDNLYHFMASHPGRRAYSESIDPIRMLRRYDDLPNGTSQWFLDYARYFLEDIEDDENRLQWATDHATQIKRQFSMAKCEHVRKKYRWLAQYHDSVISEYPFLSETTIGNFIN